MKHHPPLPKLPNFLLCITVICVFADLLQAKVIDLRAAPFAAAGDGLTDDRPALARALAEAQSGDIVLITSGNYRIVLTGQPLTIPAGVTLWAQSGKARLTLSTNGGDGDHREFLRPESDVIMEGLTIEREGDFPAVLLPIAGKVHQVTLRNCRINGNAVRYPNRYCHAIQVGGGTLKELTLHSVEISECTYGLFQTNEAKGTVDGINVIQSRFERNTASDLEFNAPRGTMSNVLVRDCYFRDNRCKTASGGFAVGFANVTNGRVEDCHIYNYASEALHVEDRSTDIQLTGNTIVGGSTVQPNGVIMVLNNSRKVTIVRNFIDARPNTNRTHLILVTAGGPNFANSTDTVIKDNVLVHGAATRTWYLQPGSGPEPTGNIIIPSEQTAKP